MRRAIFAGTFDPPTLGHLDLVRRAGLIFDELIIVVATNTTKKPFFAIDLRIEMLELSLIELGLEKTCLVRAWNGLMPEASRLWDAGFLIRGVRNAADLDQEFARASANSMLGGAETVFLPSSREHIYTSSTMVREIDSLGGDVSNMVPAAVLRRMAVKRNPELE